MRYYVTFPDGREVAIDVVHAATGEIFVEAGGRRLRADAIEQGGYVNLRIDGRVVDLWMEGRPPDVGVVTRAHRFYARVESERSRALSAALGPKATAGEGIVRSPMPGRVLKVLVQEGDEVKAGTPLVVVEAMKMENELASVASGVVAKVYVTPGTPVEGGAKLVEIR